MSVGAENMTKATTNTMTRNFEKGEEIDLGSMSIFDALEHNQGITFAKIELECFLIIENLLQVRPDRKQKPTEGRQINAFKKQLSQLTCGLPYIQLAQNILTASKSGL
jgi:hypothetical protein